MRINEPGRGGAGAAVGMHRKSSLVQNNLVANNRRCSVVFNITIPNDEGATDDQTQIIEWYLETCEEILIVKIYVF